MIAAAGARTKGDADNLVVEFLALVGSALGLVVAVVGMLLGILVAASFVDAWVFTYLWRWFALPLGLPALTYWSAFGLLLLIRAARPLEGEPEREGQGKIKNAASRFMIRVTLYPALLFGIGAFAHHMLVR